MFARIVLIVLLILPVLEQATARSLTIPWLVTLKAYPPMLKVRSLIDSLSEAPVKRKDYGALITAAPDLSSACADLLKMTYSSHNTLKVEKFRNQRDELVRSVVAYADAASNTDSAAVYRMVPKLRAQCDSVTKSLLPVSWKAFEQLRMSVYEAFGQPPITNDRKILARSLSKVNAQLSTFVKSKPPSEIAKSLAELIPAEKDVFTGLARRMDLTIKDADLSKFKLQASELNTRLMNFTVSYLQ